MKELDLARMSREEKLRAMHALWEDLAQEDEAVESPAWHASALLETKEIVAAGTERILDWDAAKQELRRRAM